MTSWLTTDNDGRPHLLPAEAVLRAHLAPHLASQQSQLNARLQTVQSENARLAAEVEAQRAEIEALLAEPELAVRDVETANGQLDAVADAIALEARSAEVEMSGT